MTVMDRKRKRTSGFESTEWTAVRCHRLLRPISSRIAPLRRLAYITEGTNSCDAGEGCPSISTTTTKAASCKTLSNTKLQEPAWVASPKHGKKTGLKCYASKQRQTKRPNHAPEQDENVITLPTPFKARIMRRETPSKTLAGVETSSPLFHMPSRYVKKQKKDPFSHAVLAKKSAELHDRQTYEKIFDLHQGVADGFSTLLERTKDQTDRPRRGAQSLFSACLRRVPDYIEAEEKWRKATDPDDDTDVSAEVYDDLENLGSSSQGWPPLREVVRAHGVKLVCTIIQDKLVSSNTRAELANMPLTSGARLEAEQLLLYYAHSLSTKRPLNVESPLFSGCLSPLQDAHLFRFQTGSAKTRIRVLHSLFTKGRLSVSWVATRDMAKILGDVLRSLTLATGNQGNAIEFLYGRISQAAGLNIDDKSRKCASRTAERSAMVVPVVSSPMGKPLQKALFNLIIVLSAIVVMSGNAHNATEQKEPGCLVASMLHDLTVRTMAERPSALQASKGTVSVSHQIRLNVLTSALVINVLTKTSPTAYGRSETGHIISSILEYDWTLQTDNRLGRTLTETLSPLLCNLVRCCGQSMGYSAQEFLENFVHEMISQANDLPVKHKSFLRELAHDTTVEFARSSRTQESTNFARNTGRLVHEHAPVQTPTPMHKRPWSTPLEKSTREAFRWEDGLCEWIAATPLSARHLSHDATEALSPQGNPAEAASIAHPADIGKLPSAEVEHSVDDSGYFSTLQETPTLPRRSLPHADIFSSPDVLSVEPLDFAKQSRSTEMQRSKRRTSEQLSVASAAKPTSSKTVDRRQRKRKPEPEQNVGEPAARPLASVKSKDLLLDGQKVVDKASISTKGDEVVVHPTSTTYTAKAITRTKTTLGSGRDIIPRPTTTTVSELLRASPLKAKHKSGSLTMHDTSMRRDIKADGDASEPDELAMSCKKSRERPSLAVRTTKPPSTVLSGGRSSAPLIVGNGRQSAGWRKGLALDDSGDELG